MLLFHSLLCAHGQCAKVKRDARQRRTSLLLCLTTVQLSVSVLAGGGLVLVDYSCTFLSRAIGSQCSSDPRFFSPASSSSSSFRERLRLDNTRLVRLLTRRPRYYVKLYSTPHSAAFATVRYVLSSVNASKTTEECDSVQSASRCVRNYRGGGVTVHGRVKPAHLQS